LKNRVMILVFLIIGLFVSSCSAENKGSGVYIPSFEDISKIAENVYIGEIISVESDAESKEESSNYPLIKYHVQIELVFKGDFEENTQIDDYVLYDFKDFLNVGDKYVFCTGINYDDRTEYLWGYSFFQPYCAVKILEDESLEVYNWSRFDRYKSSGKDIQNHFISPPPQSLNEIKQIFGVYY